MKAILLVAAVALASATPQYDRYSESEPYEPFDPPKYEFEYSVQDAASVNDYGQREERDGASTAGSYEVRLPDTRLQRVVYTVDGDSGFIADVEFDGQAQHPDEYGSGSPPAGRSYSAPVQNYGTARKYPEPARPEYVPAEPETSYEPAPSPPKVSYRPAPTTPKPSSRPAPTPPKPSYRPAPTTPKTSYRPAPTPPKTSYRPAPTPSKPSYRPAPSSPRPSYGSAPSQPEVSYAPTTSPPRRAYRPVPSPPKPSYSPVTRQPEVSYATTEATTTAEPSVYGNKKLKFERVPSDVYDKPLFRSDYERAVHSRGGSRRSHKQAAPARYGPSAVLIGSDDDRYLVPDLPAVPGLKKLLAAPWVSYQKAVDAYLSKKDQADHAEGAGKVTYGGGRGEDHEAGDSDAAASSEVPYGARIAPK